MSSWPGCTIRSLVNFMLKEFSFYKTAYSALHFAIRSINAVTSLFVQTSRNKYVNFIYFKIHFYFPNPKVWSGRMRDGKERNCKSSGRNKFFHQQVFKQKNCNQKFILMRRKHEPITTTYNTIVHPTENYKFQFVEMRKNEENQWKCIQI